MRDLSPTTLPLLAGEKGVQRVPMGGANILQLTHPALVGGKVGGRDVGSRIKKKKINTIY